MRRNLSRAESVMWHLLRDRRLGRFKFRRQYIIAPFIVDFICLHKKLIIELDGDHHDYQIDYDLKRTKYLELKGFKLIRSVHDKNLEPVRPEEARSAVSRGERCVVNCNLLINT